MNYLEVSAKVVIAKVFRDLNLQEEERWQDMIEWIAEALSFIGASPVYVTKPATICIKGHRGILPCDLESISYIQDIPSGSKVVYATDQRTVHAETTNGTNIEVPQGARKTYTLNGGYINTSDRETELFLSYKAFPTCEEGFPMVPKDVSAQTAMFWYIVKQMMYGGYTHPTFTLPYVEDQWNWYCGQSVGKMNMPNLDQLEVMRKTLMRMIPQVNLAEGFFTNQNTTDTIYE